MGLRAVCEIEFALFGVGAIAMQLTAFQDLEDGVFFALSDGRARERERFCIRDSEVGDFVQTLHVTSNECNRYATSACRSKLCQFCSPGWDLTVF